MPLAISKRPLRHTLSGLAKDIRRARFRFRLHRTWEDAARQANYDSSDLLEYRARKAEIVLREELYRGVENPGLNHLRVGVAWARSLIGPVTVVDFGGSFGEEGLALLDDPVIGADVTYVVCESPAVRERAQKLELPAQIRFVDDLSSLEACDIFYSSCALPYVEEPVKILDEALRLRPFLLILVRNCFSAQELIRVQTSLLFHNGPQGIDVPGFSNATVRYPHHTQNLAETQGKLEGAGYRLIGSHAEDSGVYPYGDEVYGRDLIFVDDRRSVPSSRSPNLSVRDNDQ